MALLTAPVILSAVTSGLAVVLVIWIAYFVVLYPLWKWQNQKQTRSSPAATEVVA